MTTQHTPALLAALETATIVNAHWSEDNTKPTCLARLTPLVNSTDGTEYLPVAYAIPVAHTLKRISRNQYGNTLEVAFILVAEADGETEAQSLLDDFHAAVKAVLDRGTSSGVHYISADIVDPYDYDLLANSGIFRCQANFQIMMATENQ
ncbi:MAG: hypothetical protein IJT83_14715 [Victivallales bacterium]|nr:hypothetical protein [Victivallales bacterium]